jgi:hypothetical protein
MAGAGSMAVRGNPFENPAPLSPIAVLAQNKQEKYKIRRRIKSAFY